MLNLVLANQQSQQYAEAYKQTTETGKPLVVLVGTEWCPGCVKMKGEVIPQMKSKGTLAQVNFAEVNAESEYELATKLVTGRSLPQLVMFVKTDTGWKKTLMTGAHSPAEVESFIKANSPQPIVRFSSMRGAK